MYEVAVRNELTGEMETVLITTGVPCDAQVQALLHLFKTRGWRKAVALQPRRAEEQLIALSTAGFTPMPPSIASIPATTPSVTVPAVPL